MDISLGLAVAVMLAGLIVMLIQRRFNEVVYVMFAMGLLAVLLKFAGHAALHIG